MFTDEDIDEMVIGMNERKEKINKLIQLVSDKANKLTDDKLDRFIDYFENKLND